MPTFCRHGRFIENCRICSQTLPGAGQAASAGSRKRGSGSGGGTATATRRRPHGGDSLRVRREGRAVEDGYGNELVPGMRASEDAARLAQEIAFASGRLRLLAVDPPGSYGEARAALLAGERERASWICFACAYLCPLEDELEPFAGIEQFLARVPSLPEHPDAVADDALEGIATGPRSPHGAERGAATVRAYVEWVHRNGGGSPEPQSAALLGDGGWTPERRFERLYERLALPGFARAARFDLLATLGRLAVYELQADSLHLREERGSSDPATLAAKRVFGIGDPNLLERRAAALAEAAEAPLDALDAALAAWGSGERAHLGAPADALDDDALQAARAALGL